MKINYLFRRALLLRFSLLMLISFCGCFIAKAQPRYRLVANDTAKGFYLVHPRVFDLTAAGIGSKYSLCGYIVGTDSSLQNFRILRISFSKSINEKPVEDYFMIPISKEILEIKMGNKIIIASLFETEEGNLTFLANRRYWVTVHLVGGKAQLKSVIDIYEKTGYGFRFILGYGETIVAFRELDLRTNCPVNNEPDTARLFIFDKNFKLISKIRIPDFETSFLDFGNYRYLDFQDGKLLILSPTRFILTTFDFNDRKIKHLDIPTIKGFNYPLLDTAIENKIRRDIPGNNTGDRSSQIFEMSDSFSVVTKMYLNGEKEIRFITESISPENSEYSLSSLKVDEDSIVYSMIDKDLNMNNKFKEGEIISKADYLFAPCNINFCKTGNYFFVFGSDNWNVNLIGITYKEFQRQAYPSKDKFKLRYYFLEEYFK